MKMISKRAADISARFEAANAERSMYERGTKFYDQLTEVIKFILGEYGGNNRGIRARYFFEMNSSGYRLITLD